MKLDHRTLEKYILNKPSTKLEYPFGEGVAVYKTFTPNGVNSGAFDEDRGKMFAIIAEGSDPLRISLKCEPELAKRLREQYESVMPGHHLNKKHWNTIVLSGQLSWQEIQDLISHSYQLVAKNRKS